MRLLPLASRPRADVREIWSHLVGRARDSLEPGPALPEPSDDELEKVVRAGWPGNARQLDTFARYYVRRNARRHTPVGIDTALDEFVRHRPTSDAWPDRKMVEAAVVALADLEGLPAELEEVGEVPGELGLDGVLSVLEIRIIDSVLNDCEGDLGRAADRLGLKKDALRKRIERRRKKSSENWGRAAA